MAATLRTRGDPGPQLLKPELLRSNASVFLQEVTVRYNNERFFLLLNQARDRLLGVAQIADLKEIVFSIRPVKNTAGSTIYPLFKEENGTSVPRINFYAHVLELLSDQAVTGVIAHELAHAWLNEKSGPVASKKRELEADEVARKWGFGPELDALYREADALYRR